MAGLRFDRRHGAPASRTPQARSTRGRLFDELVVQVQMCRVCPAMTGRARVLGPANGPLDARILFVAEAPGRLGADRTGIPLAGDRTGDNFNRLLTASGLGRHEVFLSNAVLCNPRDSSGLNRPPSSPEINNCARHLARLIDVLDPRWVVTLGAVALRAAALIEPHGCALATHTGQEIAWAGRTLVPLYHPGPRALIHRPMPQQLRDYRALGRALGRGTPLASRTA